MQGVGVCGLAQMPSVFLIQVQLCVKCWARVDQLNIYYSDELGLWQTCASGADETSQCLFFFFLNACKSEWCSERVWNAVHLYQDVKCR